MGNFVKRIKRAVEERITQPTTRHDGVRKIYSIKNLELAYVGIRGRIKPAHGVDLCLYMNHTEDETPILKVSTPNWYPLSLPPYLNISGIGKVQVIWTPDPNINPFRDRHWEKWQSMEVKREGIHDSRIYEE